MLFLIHYRPKTGEKLLYEIYPSSDLDKVWKKRLEIELKLFETDRGLKEEVNIFDAESEADFRRTHGRYF